MINRVKGNSYNNYHSKNNFFYIYMIINNTNTLKEKFLLSLSSCKNRDIKTNIDDMYISYKDFYKKDLND